VQMAMTDAQRQSRRRFNKRLAYEPTAIDRLIEVFAKQATT